MKKLSIIMMLLFLSGCNVLDGGNYEKNRSGFVQTDNILISYKTNSVGEVDLFMIDDLIPFLDALDKASFNSEVLSSNEALSSYVTQEELTICEITELTSIPRFIRIDNDSYYFKVSENGDCTYDEYNLHTEGFNKIDGQTTRDTSPIEGLGITRFSMPNFTINSFESVLFIEEISYSLFDQEWERRIITPLPMSVRQEGNIYEDNEQVYLEYSIIENYVIRNQSINRLELREDYLDEEVFNIWSEETIDILGRDHEMIKNVRNKQTYEILIVIEDTLGRLGLF
jgi:hypothetical protein